MPGVFGLPGGYPREEWDRGGESVAVEILHTRRCANWEAALDVVERVAHEERIAVKISARLVDSMGLARELRLHGSPTVRVAGRDLQPEVDEHDDFSLG